MLLRCPYRNTSLISPFHVMTSLLNTRSFASLQLRHVDEVSPVGQYFSVSLQMVTGNGRVISSGKVAYDFHPRNLRPLYKIFYDLVERDPYVKTSFLCVTI